MREAALLGLPSAWQERARAQPYPVGVAGSGDTPAPSSGSVGFSIAARDRGGGQQVRLRLEQVPPLPQILPWPTFPREGSGPSPSSAWARPCPLAACRPLCSLFTCSVGLGLKVSTPGKPSLASLLLALITVVHPLTRPARTIRTLRGFSVFRGPKRTRGSGLELRGEGWEWVFRQGGPSDG